MPSLDRGGGQKGHHLWLPKSSRLGRAMSPEGPAAGSGPEVPRLPQPGLGAPPARTQAPRHPCRWFVMESPRSYSTPSSAPGDRASPPCVGPLPPPNPHMTIVRFVSGVGNLLGFFPTIMALSVPVFSVFSTCEIDVYGKKRKKKKKKKEPDLLYKNHYFVCSACYSFWEWFAHSLSHSSGPPFSWR